MEAEPANNNLALGMATRFPVVGPILLISMGYIDAGKWSAIVEGGARFGQELVLLLVVFSCAAILCQYVAVCITIVTGKNLAQICKEEYSKSTCMVLAIQAEVSMIILDMTMIIGIAHGVNILFGLNLFTCLLFTAMDAVLFLLFATLLGKRSGNLIFVCTASILLSYCVFRMLVDQPKNPVVNEVPVRLDNQTVFTLMSLLGANIMPHNFYVHSSIIQQQIRPANASMRALFHDHFFAILCVFSGIYLVNYVLMKSAATVFKSAGIAVLTSQDVLLLLEQVFRTPMALFILAMFLSSQITTLTWNVGGQVVVHELLGVDLPVLFNRAAIRVLVILLSLYSTWNSEEEQIYQLLVFTQVMMAMLLPSSVFLLLQVATSRSIMGPYRISLIVELLTFTTGVVMLGLNIMFLVEIFFGHIEWLDEFWWDLERRMSLPNTFLLITGFASLVFTLWLVATPVKSATLRTNTQRWIWNAQRRVPEEPVTEELEMEYEYYVPEEFKSPSPALHLPCVDEYRNSQRSLTGHSEVTPKVEFVPEGIVDEEVASKDDGLQADAETVSGG